MTCQQIQDELLLYVGGELPADLQAHVNQCADCRAVWDELLNLGEMLPPDAAFEPDASVVAELVAGVEQSIDRLERPAVVTPLSRSWYRPLAIAASVMLVFAATYITYRFQQNAQTMLTADGGTTTVTQTLTTDESTELMEPDDATLHVLLNDYAEGSQFEASEYLLDDLTDEEYEYLQEHFDVGDLL